MKRSLAIIVVLGGVGLAVVGAAASAGASGIAPRSQLRAFTCRNALDPQDRTIAVKAVMRPLSGTQKLQLKFSLLVSRGNPATTSSVRAGNLGSWLSPRNATLGQLAGDVWNFQKSVFELDAPATYQFRVSFRWLGSGGRVLGTALRFTRRCRQRELRSDLMVLTPVAVTPVTGDPSHDTYTAVIRNNTGPAVGPFVVELVSGAGTAVGEPVTVPRLDPASSQTVSLVGPACTPTSPLSVTVVSAHDLDPANNSVAVLCPGGSGGG